MREKLNTIKKLIKGQLTNRQTQLILHLSKRQIIRIKQRYLKEGERALIHGLVGKQGNNRTNLEIGNIALNIVRQKYSDFGPTLASEHLEVDDGIKINKESLRQLMIKTKIWAPKQRRKQKFRSKRIPRGSMGEMIQYDGSYDHWLEDRGGTGEICVLMGVDDATSKLLLIHFASDEGINCTLTFWKEYLLTYGKPLQIYLDKFTTYRSSLATKGIDREAKTQFGRAMDQLNVQLLFANSPQAKGRVERRFGNLQDRLIKEMRLNNINTIEEANTFVKNIFIPWFNNRYSKPAQTTQDLHRKLSQSERYRINSILSVQHERTVKRDFTVFHDGKVFQLLRSNGTAVFSNDKVIVEEWTNGEIKISKNIKCLKYVILKEKPVHIQSKPQLLPPKSIYIPPSDHEFKKKSFQRYLAIQKMKR